MVRLQVYEFVQEMVSITDVDECQTNNGGCNQTCTNEYGLFECSCDIGYTLALDGLDCDGEDLNLL